MGQLLYGSRAHGISYEPIPTWPESSVDSTWAAPSVTERFKGYAAATDINVATRSLDAILQSPIYRDNIEALSKIVLSNATMLDFGCANGMYHSILSAHPATLNWKYVGADINAELVRFCRAKYPETRFESIDEDKALPFKDNEFDIVFASGVIHYINDYVKVVSELHRTTNDYLVITRLPLWKYNKQQIVLQHVYHEWGEEHHPIYVFNRNEIEDFFNRMGFTMLWHDYGSEFFYVASVAEPVIHNTYVLRKKRSGL